MNTRKIVDYIVKWLADYLGQSGMNGFVAGISGGIDSAVTSTLCALTGKPVLTLRMPIHQVVEQHTLAARHIEWLLERFDAVKTHTVDLTPPFEALKKVLPAGIQDDLTMANTRARLRMTTLYSFSSHYRMLVAGTGNKVEDFGVGFFTKYGDGGVDISPIADLMKSEVRELARELGIIEEIRNAKPTDGLWHDNRSDEDQIGASYDELEWAMRFEESGRDLSGLTERQMEVLSIYRKANRVNRHKMIPIPKAVIPDALWQG